ncbi:hypothetical protein DH2020_036887 [Rehmannia glutinosa]|uniref:Late embryogenesis abundant protein LEA-2 subgroup domain-containing protein n=1 Tax=Rehmannia glutinosa TaxID=99300 RepID=A0ABR0V5K7_REHGL
MSRITEKSPKDCATKQSLTKFNKLNKKLLIYLSTFFLTLLSFIFLVWLILHPTKPQFSLKQADINQLNLSRPSNILNSSIHLTIQSNNPNKRVGIYYDEFLIHASYKGQIITQDTFLSPFYEDHEETNIQSLILIGNQQFVGPSLGYQVVNDQRTGKLGLNFRILGKLRWKLGNWVSGKHDFSANCVTVIPFGDRFSSPFMSSIQGTECSATI